jgi:hypothetical protein
MKKEYFVSSFMANVLMALKMSKKIFKTTTIKTDKTSNPGLHGPDLN